LVNKTNKRKSQPFLFLGIFLILWWGMPATWKIMTKSAFGEFQAPLWDLSSRVDDLSNYWGHLSDSKQTLIEKGKNGSRLKSDFELQGRRTDGINDEIVRLRSLKASLGKLEDSLNLDAAKSFEPILARVSHRSLSGWWQKITIRKGRNHGLEPGFGVIFNGGVMGRVKSVNARSAEIELITNPTFRIVAHFEGDDRPVTFQGNGIAPGGTPFGLALDVPHDLVPAPESPLALVSSDLGGTFPHGIPIGIVESLSGGEDGLFKSGNVILDPKLNQVQEVTILIPR
jgi:rod shape-determining protein MreC